MFGPHLSHRAQTIISGFAKKNLKIATVESCTGGMVAALLTEISGSSAVVDRGFVTYSNQAKQDLVDVPRDILNDQNKGAVSQECAEAMARGGLQNSLADVVVSITGIAGPTGGTDNKPVGLVWFGVARRDQPTVQTYQKIFPNFGRSSIRIAALEFALLQLENVLKDV